MVNYSLLFSQTNYFNKIYNRFSSESGISITETDSFYYFIAIGNGSDSITGLFYQKLILNKSDKSGNILNTNIIEYPERIYPSISHKTLIKTHDNNFVACGFYWDTVQIMGYIIKFNTDLDTLWTRTYSDPDSLYPGGNDTILLCAFTSIKETNDNGFILAGYYFRGTSSGYDEDILLVKTDSLGNQEWLKKMY